MPYCDLANRTTVGVGFCCLDKASSSPCFLRAIRNVWTSADMFPKPCQERKQNNESGDLKSVKLAVLCIAVVLACGCTHPMPVAGEGDATAASVSRNKSPEDYQRDLAKCRQNAVAGDYFKTNMAEPHANAQPRGAGGYCNATLSDECGFNAPASAVQSFFGQSTSPSLAVYKLTTNTGFTAIFIGNGFDEQFAARIRAHAVVTGFSERHGTVFVGDNGQGAPQAVWSDGGHREAIQELLNPGDVDVVGMTYDSRYPDVTVYKKWVKYALSRHPDTRFFVATSLSSDPGSVTGAQYAANYETLHARVHTLIDTLRAAFPGVDIDCLPSGQGAVELYTRYSEGQLPGVLALVGDPATAVFSDNSGRPGDMLAALESLIWLDAIYDVDTSGFSVDPGVSPDIKDMATAILAGHAAKYDTPVAVEVARVVVNTSDQRGVNPARKPNILLIVADDLGYNDLAINNDNTEIDTPNMDQIARDGVRFTRHYAAAVCSPARAALLTGFYPERLGYLPNGRGISPEVVTLPERLKEAGYTTWHIGKWHIGDLERTAWPDHQGFDHWFGFLNQSRLAGGQTPQGEIVLSRPRYNDPWLESDSAPGKHFTGHLENILTDRAIQVISDLNGAHEPWFVNLWFYAPHGPVTPAPEFAQKYPDTPAGKYRALVNQLDYNIGRVVAHLDTVGALQNTIIVVASDNGGTNDFVNSNAPFYGNKTTLTEGGLRTPLLIKWPDATINGRVIADSVSIEDIYPTLLESIGVAPPDNLDGESFYRSVQQQAPITPKARYWDHIMTPAWTSYGALSADGRWRLFNTPPVYGVQVPLLYDSQIDPTFSKPVAVTPTPPAELAQLSAGYQAWYKDVHTVKMSFVPNDNGSGALTGMDFLRTPGFGTYTFGIAVPGTHQGPIAGQPGIWDMSRTGNTVTAQFGELTLSGELPNNDSCHSVVISGNFSRQVQSGLGPDRITLSLYINGVEAQSADVEATLQVDDPTVETIIGDPGATAAASMLQPVILNTALHSSSPWTLVSFSQHLCENN